MRKTGFISHHPFQVALSMILSIVLSVSAQTGFYPAEPAPTRIDTLKDGAAVEHIKADSSVINMAEQPEPKPWIPPPGVELKNNETAYTLAILGFFILPFVGSSLGQFYAGSYAQGSWAIAGGVAGLALFGTAVLFSEAAAQRGGADNTSAPLDIAVTTAAIGGLGLLVGSTVYSFVDTHLAVRRANEKIRAQYFGFSPELFPSSKGGVNPGVMAWVSF